MGEIYSTEAKQETVPGSSQDVNVTRKIYDNIVSRYRGLSTTQTEESDLDVSSVQTNTENDIFDNNISNHNGSDVSSVQTNTENDVFDNNISSHNGFKKCFCDKLVQTELLSPDHCNMWDSCTQTDDAVNIMCSSSTQTTDVTDLSAQTDVIIVKDLKDNESDCYVPTKNGECASNESNVPTSGHEQCTQTTDTSSDLYDSSVQTDAVIVKDLNYEVSDCSVQTKEDKYTSDEFNVPTGHEQFTQTTGTTGDLHDSNAQTDAVIVNNLNYDVSDCSVQGKEDESASSESNVPTDHEQSAQLCTTDYLHIDNLNVVINKADEVNHCKQNDIQSHHSNKEDSTFLVCESELVEEQTKKHNENLLLKTYQSGDLNSNEVRGVVGDEEEWKTRYMVLQKQMEEEIGMRRLLEVDHQKKLEFLQNKNKDMKQVVQEYEHVIVELTEQSQDRMLVDNTLSETINEKEHIQQDLNKAEGNLVDAYRRIEKLKGALDTYKENEESMKQSMNNMQMNLQKSEEKYNRLKQQATEKMDAANCEIEKVRKQKEVDLAGLQAALKKSQSRNVSLEKEIEQKTSESKELSQICDELIKRVSVE